MIRSMLAALATLLVMHTVLAQQNSAKFRTQQFNSENLLKADIKNDFVKYDISPLLLNTRFPLGFIGDNYQRFHIRFISVIKNKANPSQYFVYGKTMVKDNICEFQGTITIGQVYNFKAGDDPEHRRGRVLGEYMFYENASQKYTGQFKGVFSLDWYLDKNGALYYDDLDDVADGYANNQFAGTWTSYTGTLTKICNWGDSRIPMSDDLDVGSGEFFPDEKYVANGWTSYHDAYLSGYDQQKIDNALKIENAEWWK